MGYFATFTKTGDPNQLALPRWPRYNATKSELMMFTPDSVGVVQADPWKARLDLIERAVEVQAVAVAIATWPRLAAKRDLQEDRRYQ